MEAAVLDGVPEQSGRRKHAGQFAKGGDPRQSHVMAATVKGGRKPVEVAENPLLTAFRHVLTNVKSHDGPGLEREAREWLKSDRKGFLTKYSELEKAEAAGKVEADRVQVVAKEEEADGSEGRVLEMIGELEREMDHAVAG